MKNLTGIRILRTSDVRVQYAMEYSEKDQGHEKVAERTKCSGTPPTRIFVKDIFGLLQSSQRKAKKNKTNGETSGRISSPDRGKIQ